MADPTRATEHPVRWKDKDAEISKLKDALLTIAELEPSSKNVFRKYQIAVQTARIALGLTVK